MRNLTIKREKCFVAFLSKMKVYIEDASSSDILINNVAYKKIGELKNGEEKTFVIPDNAVKVAVIADNVSRNFCNDCYEIPAGETDVYLSGKNEFNLATGNAFRFHGVTEENLLQSRKKASKKGLAILAFSIVIGVIVGCIVGSVMSSKNTNVKPKEFTKAGMNITLTDKFTEKPQEGYTVCYDSQGIAILAIKEKFSDFEDFEEYTIEQYGELVLESNKTYSPSDIQNNNGLTYFNYVFKNPDTNQTYKYFTALYKASDSFWIVQFATLENQYSKYEAQFFDWAKSITFDEE